MKDKNKVFALAMFSKKAGDYVPVARKLIEAGSCCGEGCLKCPYTPKHVKGATTVDPEAKRELEKQERGDVLEGLYPGNVKSAGLLDNARKILSLFGKGSRASKGSGLAKMFTTPKGRKDLLLDWLIPGTVGYGGYHTAREHGVNPFSSALIGIGSASMGSPRDYATVWKLRNKPIPVHGLAGPGRVLSPFTSFTTRMLPLAFKKGIFAGSGYLLDLLAGASRTQHHVESGSEHLESVAETLARSAKNVEEGSLGVKGFTQSLNATMGGLQDSFDQFRGLLTGDPRSWALKRVKDYFIEQGNDPAIVNNRSFLKELQEGMGIIDPNTGYLDPIGLTREINNPENSLQFRQAAQQALDILNKKGEPTTLPFKLDLIPKDLQLVPEKMQLDVIPESMTKSVESLSGTADALKKFLEASKPSMLAGAGLLGGGFAGGLLSDAFARRVEGPEDSRINRRRRSIGILIGSLLGGVGGLAATPEGQKVITGVPDWFSRKMLD